MSLANKITLGRLVLAFLLFGLLAVLDVEGERGVTWLIVCMLLFITVVATDALDGYYARKYSQVSDFGRVADPAVDKIVVCGTLVFLTATEWARPILPPWIVVLMITREFTINGLRGFVESRGIRFGSDWGGKLKMIVQCVAIPAVFFFEIIEKLVPDVSLAVDASRWFAHGTVWLALILALYSGVEYITKATHILRSES